MSAQRGSIEAMIMAGLAILLVAALGVIFWQNFIHKPEETSSISSTSDITEDNKEIEEIKEEAAEEGVITGSLTYPSHGIPPSLTVHATNLITGEEFSTSEHLPGSQYKYGRGYKITAPAGTYHVYATVSDDAFRDQRAYHTNFIACEGSFSECQSIQNPEERIVVTVEANQDTSDVIIGDWYNLCLAPGGKQPTEKFDLPAC